MCSLEEKSKTFLQFLYSSEIEHLPPHIVIALTQITLKLAFPPSLRLGLWDCILLLLPIS